VQWGEVKYLFFYLHFSITPTQPLFTTFPPLFQVLFLFLISSQSFFIPGQPFCWGKKGVARWVGSGVKRDDNNTLG